ncbi:hypothetical protein JW848_04525 [Candidatus Bipolaricaulota bacterium]|nr:hypothetical protein [Candidatus Bipolaricaulota bacterium]
MARLRRRWRILKWVGLLFSFVALSAWVWSHCSSPIYDLGSHPLAQQGPLLAGGEGSWVFRTVQFADGEVLFSYEFDPSVSMSLPDDLIDWSWLQVNGFYIGLVLPLWIPFVIAVIPTGVLWYLDRRRIPPGYCRKCGYDLTGNVSGVCPECGEHISGVDGSPGS